MKEWILTFIGRRVGAIGISYPIRIRLIAPDRDLAIEKLYEVYEHVHGLTVTPVEREVTNANKTDVN